MEHILHAEFGTALSASTVRAWSAVTKEMTPAGASERDVPEMSPERFFAAAVAFMGWRTSWR